MRTKESGNDDKKGESERRQRCNGRVCDDDNADVRECGTDMARLQSLAVNGHEFRCCE